jgi:hypothetical protein
MSNSTMSMSRGKVWLHMVAGEALGRPLAEWAYRTPRYPRGVKASDLSDATPGIQRETMVVWFLANHVPAKGPYFGFSGPTPRHSPNSIPLAQSIEVAGFNQAPFFSGGLAPDLLKTEFAEFVRQPVILEVAGLFDGLWQHLPPEPIVDFEKQTPEEQKTTLVSILDELTKTVRNMVPAHGQIGHNGPPSTITDEETHIVLRATAEVRLAVLSSDYDAAHLVWESISPIVKKIGNSIAKQVDNYCTKFGSTFGVTSAFMAAGVIGYELGFWDKAEAISAMLEIAKHFAH